MDNKQIAIEIRSAIKNGNVQKVVELIDSNTELLNMETPFGTWLHVAASRGKLDIVKKLVELGSDINELGGVYGGGALNEAASSGHIEIVRYLLLSGANLDVSKPERNPLFGAISNGHVDIAKLLIKSGIETDVKYSGEFKEDMDALTFAREQGQIEIVKLLDSPNKWSTIASTTNENNPNQHDVILKHMAKYFGKIKNTISETIPGSRIAANIHIIEPSINKDFVTLFTTGMSDEPMDYSKKENEYKYSELLLKLPSSWKIGKEDSNDPNNYWPLAWLRKVAHIPHIYDGWIEEGVIIPHGEPPQPFASNTNLSCVMVSRAKENGLDSIQTKQGTINVYALIPIYAEERMLALEKGHDYLIKIMNDKGISDVLDIDRINVGIL